MPKQDPPAWVLDERRAIGQRIHAAREHANYRQEALANLIGVDRRTIQRIEAGVANPTITTLLLISSALGEPLLPFSPTARECGSVNSPWIMASSRL